MEINIYTKKHSEDDVNQVIECFKNHLSEKGPKWEKTSIGISGTCKVSLSVIKEIFEELAGIFPDMEYRASDSYDVREEDGSAQWWCTETVYSEVVDGKTVIKESSGTYWN